MSRPPDANQIARERGIDELRRVLEQTPPLPVPDPVHAGHDNGEQTGPQNDYVPPGEETDKAARFKLEEGIDANCGQGCRGRDIARDRVARQICS